MILRCIATAEIGGRLVATGPHYADKSHGDATRRLAERAALASLIRFADGQEVRDVRYRWSDVDAASITTRSGEVLRLDDESFVQGLRHSP